MDFKGLYHKALAIRKQDGSGKTPQTSTIVTRDNEEEEELKKINELIDSKRLDINPETFLVKARKKGSALPFFINLAALLLIIAGSAILIALYNQSEHSITSDKKNYHSNESNLLSAVKDELNQKEAQISTIQQQMQSVQREKDQLKKEMATRLSSREQELAQELKKELEAEKKKLLQQGLAASVVEQKIQNAEKQKEAEKKQQLAIYREELTSELTKKEADYSQTLAAFEQKLETARQSHTQLTEELQKSKVAQQKLAEQQASLQVEHSRMADELAKMQELKQKENFIIDQINAYYNQVNSQVKTGQYPAALQSLAGLEELLNTKAVTLLPAMQQRKATDLFIVQTLKKYLTEANLPADKQEPVGKVDKKAEKDRLTLKVKEGEKFFQQKDYQKAFNSYVATLDTLNLDSEYLNQLKTRFLNAGKALYTGEQQAKENRDATVLINQALAREMTRQTLLKQLEQFKRDYEQLIQKKQTSAPRSEAEMLALLDAKVLVKQIISSEPVRTQYPDLYNLLEHYFKALSEEQRLEGERLVLADLVNFMDNLDNNSKLATIRKNWSAIYSRTTNELLLRLISRLQALLGK